MPQAAAYPTMLIATSYSSFTFSVMMIAAVTAANTVSQRGAISSPILALRGSELHQRHNGEGELQRQDDLAQDQQLSRLALAIPERHEHRRNDGDEPRGQPPQPGGQPYVDEAFHDDLPGHGGGHGRVEAAGEERDGEEARRDGRAEQGGEQLVRPAQFRHTSVWPVL